MCYACLLHSEVEGSCQDSFFLELWEGDRNRVLLCLLGSAWRWGLVEHPLLLALRLLDSICFPVVAPWVVALSSSCGTLQEGVGPPLLYPLVSLFKNDI